MGGERLLSTHNRPLKQRFLVYRERLVMTQSSRSLSPKLVRN